MRSYRWQVRDVPDPGNVIELAEALNNLPQALARALFLRGVTDFETARSFFRPTLDGLHDPFAMRNMDAAAERLARAITSKERVLVYGDYDVDGVTSAVLMVSFLRSRGVSADYFIPDRRVHGYGLCNAGIDVAAANGAQLIVALDCGITATGPATYARSLGIDLVICDHHTAGAQIPDALAVLDPKQPQCSYPFDELSGCGVGFKLVQATLGQLGESQEHVSDLLALVAISIASDIVPIRDENRILMRAGLQQLAESPSVGLKALADIARVSLETCGTSDIVFGIAPRINAAGRLQHAGKAVDLLLATDDSVARSLAAQLEEINIERRAIDKDTVAQAERSARRMLESRDRSGIVLHDPSWHAGVIGITASRIVERFCRPTVMLTNVNGVAKGSARSIAGVNVYNALKSCEDLLLQFGGHDYAAGLQLEVDKVDEFRERFDDAVSQQMRPEFLIPALKIDAPVALDEIDARFWAVLAQFEPFGPANPRPVFVHRELQVLGRPSTVGRDRSHLKFVVRQREGGRAIPAIGFGMAGHLDKVVRSQQEGIPLEMAFTVDENTYRGEKSIQLKPRDLRLAREQEPAAVAL